MYSFLIIYIFYISKNRIHCGQVEDARALGIQHKKIHSVYLNVT